MKRQIRLSRAPAAVLCSSVLATTRRVHARFEVDVKNGVRFRATDSPSKTNTS
jgi:hypothetical protein